MQQITNLITTAISKNAEQILNNNPITTDDLIPIISYILIQSKLSHLHSNLFYMENFNFTNISMNALGYLFILFFYFI
jgi:hypothetical protein